MSDQEIGRIVAVDAAHVTVELSKDLKALATSTYEGVSEVGRINSYVIIPTGAHRVVGMVTRVVMSEESQLRADQITLSLPAARRHLYATLVGTIDGFSFEQGVSIFPVLDTSVMMTTKHDLEAIFGRPDQGA
ncbi:ATPase, partial [Candidatus Bipolaricaulota bacterium]